MSDTQETVRETLRQLEQEQARTQRALTDAENLLTGLELVTENPGLVAIFADLSKLFQPAIGYTQGLLLRAQPNDEKLRVVGTFSETEATSLRPFSSPVQGANPPLSSPDDGVTTTGLSAVTARLNHDDWPLSPLLKRTWTLGPIAVEDIREIPSWPDWMRDGVGSALLVPLGDHIVRCLWVCLSPRRAAFGPEQLTLMRRFAAVANGTIAAHWARQDQQAAERQQHLDALFLARARLEAGLSHLPSGIQIVSESGEVLFVNQAWHELHGRLGSEQQQHPPPGTGPMYDERLPLPDGGVLGSHFTPLHVDGVAAGHVWQLTDRTDRERRERRLRDDKEQAELANEAKTRFLGVMSHEMRTPLNAIIGFTELVLGDELPNRQRQLIELVRGNSEVLLNLISDLLDVSKIEAGQLDLDAAVFSLGDLVEDVCATHAVRAEGRGLRLISDVEANLPRNAVGDRARLRQVLTNLVGNAVKHTEQGHIRVISTASVKAGCAHYVVEVHDTGPGIPVNERAGIFEAFERLSQSTGASGGGASIGLTVARSLVRRMGGDLVVLDEVTTGAAFRVTLALPLHGPAQPHSVWGHHEQVGAHLLIYNAHTPSSSALKKVLAQWGFKVDLVSTLRAARDRISSQIQPRLEAVFVDCDSVEADGIAAQDFARETRALVGAPVLLLAQPATASAWSGRRGQTTCISLPSSHDIILDGLADAWHISMRPRRARRQSNLVRSMGTRRTRILLVEDHPDNTTLVVSFMEAAGWSVTVARNGLEGVQLFCDQGADVVLMDLQMPVMDGFEATRRMRAHESELNLNRTPIIAVTAHAMAAYRDRCIQVGMNDYLAKPISRDALIETIDRWLASGPTVLVVDDAADNRLLMRYFLAAGTRTRVLMADDGRRGVELAEAERPALILLDMEMPVMTGYEAATVIRGRSWGENLPIIGVTAHRGAGARQRCLDAGCTAYLSRPVRWEELAELIEYHVPEAMLEQLGRGARSTLPQRTSSVATTAVRGASKLGSPYAPTSASTAVQAPASAPDAADAEDAEEPGVDAIIVRIPADLSDLAPGFLANRRADLARSAALRDSDDFDGLMRLGHGLKGVCASYGFSKLSTIGHELETAAKLEDLALVTSTIAAMDDYLSRVWWVADEDD